MDQEDGCLIARLGVSVVIDHHGLRASEVVPEALAAVSRIRELAGQSEKMRCYSF